MVDWGLVLFKTRSEQDARTSPIYDQLGGASRFLLFRMGLPNRWLYTLWKDVNRCRVLKPTSATNANIATGMAPTNRIL